MPIRLNITRVGRVIADAEIGEDAEAEIGEHGDRCVRPERQAVGRPAVRERPRALHHISGRGEEQARSRPSSARPRPAPGSPAARRRARRRKTAITQLNRRIGSSCPLSRQQEDDALGHRRRRQAAEHRLRDQPVGHHAPELEPGGGRGEGADAERVEEVDDRAEPERLEARPGALALERRASQGGGP